LPVQSIECAAFSVPLRVVVEAQVGDGEIPILSTRCIGKVQLDFTGLIVIFGNLYFIRLNL
jgi:hypothetical protein